MSTNPDDPDEKPRRQHPMLNRRKRWTIGIWVFLFNFVLAILVIYTLLSITQTPLSAPGWVRERLEEQVNTALPSGRVRIGALNLTVNDAGFPTIKLENLIISDGSGAETARLNGASLRLSSVAMLSGQFRPRQLDISGAQVTLRRLGDGTVDLSFGGNTSSSGSIAALLDNIERSLDQPVLQEVDDVTASDLTITFEDALSGRVWQITDGRMRLARADHGLDLSVLFDVFNGTEDLASVEFGLQTQKDSSAATIRARFDGAAARDIAVQSPALSYLSVLNAPISGAVLARLDETGRLAELSGTLEIEAGALQPSAATRPLQFDHAGAYFTYNPELSRITFSEVSVEGPALTATATGQAYLRDFTGDWPSTLVAQLAFSNLTANPDGLWPEPVSFASGSTDLRIRISPFSVEIGQIVLDTGSEKLLANGSLDATDQGWIGSVNAQLDGIGIDRLVAVWPPASLPNTRTWLADNITSGQFNDVRVAVRTQAQGAPIYEMGFGYDRAAIRVAEGFPIITNANGYGVFRDQQAIFVLDGGEMRSPAGDPVDLAGSYFRVPDLGGSPATSEIEISASGKAEAVMAILAAPPLRVLAATDLKSDFLTGDASLSARVTYPMKPDRTPDELHYQATAEIRNAKSLALVPNKVLEMPLVNVVVDKTRIEVAGGFQIGQVLGQGRWQSLMDGTQRSNVTGQFTLSQGFVDEFNIGLPEGMITGQSAANFEIELAPDGPPLMTFSSDISGLEMALPQIDVRKPRGTPGQLEVQGKLGPTPSIDDLDLSFPGLVLNDGVVSLSEAGLFDRLAFGSGSIGDWYRGGLTIEGRGEGLQPRILADGTFLDLTKLPFGSGQGTGVAAGGPVRLAIDRVQATRNITLDGTTGDLDLSAGVSGQFTGRVNGGAQIRGQLETVRDGVAIRITSDTGGEVMRDSGIFPSATGGTMSLVLNPITERGLYRGDLRVQDARVQRAPVLTELLSALSVVGLLDQMRGAGIVFTDVAADFILREDGVDLLSSSAVGPSLGISLDGTYDATRSRLDMQGVISPVYFLNALGRVVSSREGEGLFGFNFRLSGPTDAPNVQVNPLSVLAPGFLRDIFRKQDQ